MLSKNVADKELFTGLCQITNNKKKHEEAIRYPGDKGGDSGVFRMVIRFL